MTQANTAIKGLKLYDFSLFININCVLINL